MSDLFADNQIDWKKLFIERRFGKDDAEWNKFFDERLGPKIVEQNEEEKKPTND